MSPHEGSNERIRNMNLEEQYKIHLAPFRNLHIQISEKWNEWKLLNKQSPKYNYLFQSIKGQAVYRIFIEGKYYVCVHKGSLFTCLKYHIKRAFRDHHVSLKDLPSVNSAYAINNTWTPDIFFKNGGKIEILQSGIENVQAIKNEIEYSWIDKAVEEFGKEKVWNRLNKHSKFIQKL